MDENIEAFVWFDPSFPLLDVFQIGRSLSDKQCLIPGWIPPAVGFLDPRSILYTQTIEKIGFVLLPDRNIVSEWVRIARDKASVTAGTPAQTAAAIMAFCSTMEILVEPSIAFHELAHWRGSDAANEELSWFRAADNAHPLSWVDLAVGRSQILEPVIRSNEPILDFSIPLRRWRRNYIVALKVAELELTPLRPVDKATQLLHWMNSEFFLAGSAAIFALRFFTNGAPRRGLIKSLRSADREKALAGIQNAAWDMTYMSDFVERVGRPQSSGCRYLFASADRHLASMVPLLLLDAEKVDPTKDMERALISFWTPSEAQKIASELFASIRIAQSPQLSLSAKQGKEGIENLITRGEEFVRAWRP